MPYTECQSPTRDIGGIIHLERVPEVDRNGKSMTRVMNITAQFTD